MSSGLPSEGAELCRATQIGVPIPIISLSDPYHRLEISGLEIFESRYPIGESRAYVNARSTRSLIGRKLV
jgi:hypothetical protein